MYEIGNDRSGKPVCVIENGVRAIPLDPDNRDYVQFLEDWKNGAEVLNPDGTPAPYVAPETPLTTGE